MAMRRRVWRSARPRTCVTSSPSKTTLPCVGSIRRFTQRNSVDLPAPEQPMMLTNSPRATESDTSSRAFDHPS